MNFCSGWTGAPGLAAGLSTLALGPERATAELFRDADTAQYTPRPMATNPAAKRIDISHVGSPFRGSSGSPCGPGRNWGSGAETGGAAGEGAAMTGAGGCGAAARGWDAGGCGAGPAAGAALLVQSGHS